MYSRHFVKPRVVVSQCLEFAACRYNGEKVRDDWVSAMKDFVEFVPVCPEVAIGLGTPREPVRLVIEAGRKYLVQPATGKDVTQPMADFAEKFLRSQKPIDGFLLKSRSPSCAIKDSKSYPAIDGKIPLGKTSGFFGEAVVKQFVHLAIEDEARLNDSLLRHHFLTKLFTLADFRRVKASRKMKELVDFQARNKFLFMAYHQSRMRLAGKLVGNQEQKTWSELLNCYEQELTIILTRVPRSAAYVNVFEHIVGYFAKYLTLAEKKHYLQSLRQFQVGKFSIGSILYLLESWINRFDDEYLRQQTLFQPYPALLAR